MVNGIELLKLRTKPEFYKLIGKYLETGLNERKAIEQTEKELTERQR